MVLVLIQDSELFVFTGDGISLISGFTKMLCTPENPLLAEFSSFLDGLIISKLRFVQRHI